MAPCSARVLCAWVCSALQQFAVWVHRAGSVFPAQPEKSSPANPVVREVIQNAPSEASGPENSRGRLLFFLLMTISLFFYASSVLCSRELWHRTMMVVARWRSNGIFVFYTDSLPLESVLGLASFSIVFRGSVQRSPALSGPGMWFTWVLSVGMRWHGDRGGMV